MEKPSVPDIPSVRGNVSHIKLCNQGLPDEYAELAIAGQTIKLESDDPGLNSLRVQSGKKGIKIVVFTQGKNSRQKILAVYSYPRADRHQWHFIQHWNQEGIPWRSLLKGYGPSYSDQQFLK